MCFTELFSKAPAGDKIPKRLREINI